MSQKPRSSSEPIMTRWMATRYLITGWVPEKCWYAFHIPKWKWSHYWCNFRLYVGCATVGAFIGHYRSQGISLKQLSSWSKCGSAWLPPDGTTCDTLFRTSGREFPQTLSLTVLVCIELFKALSAVSVDSSLFTIGPNKNPMLVLGVAVPFLVHVFLLYSSELGFSGLSKSFGLVRSFLFWDKYQMHSLYCNFDQPNSFL